MENAWQKDLEDRAGSAIGSLTFSVPEETVKSPAGLPDINEDKTITYDQLLQDKLFAQAGESIRQVIGTDEENAKTYNDKENHDYAISAMRNFSYTIGSLGGKGMVQQLPFWMSDAATPEQTQAFLYAMKRYKQLNDSNLAILGSMASDPTTLVGLAGTIATAGLGGLAWAGVKKKTIDEVVKKVEQSIVQKSLIKQTAGRMAVLGATQGALYTGTQNVGEQLMRISGGEQEGINKGEAALSAVTGAVVGAGLAVGVPYATSKVLDWSLTQRVMSKLRGRPVPIEQITKETIPAEIRQQAVKTAEDIQITAREQLDKLGLKDVNVSALDKVLNGEADAAYDPALKLIQAALDTPEERLASEIHHESMHAVKDLNLLTPEETAILESKAESWLDDPILAKAGETVRQINGDLTGDALKWEGIASAFAGHMDGRFKPEGVIGKIFDKISKIFEALRNAFRGHGFKTADDVFDAITSGEIGSRNIDKRMISFKYRQAIEAERLGRPEKERLQRKAEFYNRVLAREKSEEERRIQAMLEEEKIPLPEPKPKPEPENGETIIDRLEKERLAFQQEQELKYASRKQYENSVRDLALRNNISYKDAEKIINSKIHSITDIDNDLENFFNMFKNWSKEKQEKFIQQHGIELLAIEDARSVLDRGRVQRILNNLKGSPFFKGSKTHAIQEPSTETLPVRETPVSGEGVPEAHAKGQEAAGTRQAEKVAAPVETAEETGPTPEEWAAMREESKMTEKERKRLQATVALKKHQGKPDEEQLQAILKMSDEQLLEEGGALAKKIARKYEAESHPDLHTEVNIDTIPESELHDLALSRRPKAWIPTTEPTPEPIPLVEKDPVTKQAVTNFDQMSDLAKGIAADPDKIKEWETQFKKIKQKPQTFEEIKASAADIQGWDALIKSRQGKALEPEENVALRHLYLESQDHLKNLVHAFDVEPNDENCAAFAAHMKFHQTLMEEVEGKISAQARSLGARKIEVGPGSGLPSNVPMLIEMNKRIREQGGNEKLRLMASDLRKLYDVQNIEGVNNYLKFTTYDKTLGSIQQAWVGAMIGPKSVVAAAISNLAFLPITLTERKAASIIGKIRGGADIVAEEEAITGFHAMLNAFMDGATYSNAMRAMKTKIPTIGTSKLNTPRTEYLSSKTWETAPGSTVSNALDFIGFMSNLFPTGLNGVDDIAKNVGHRMETHMQAIRATAEDIRSGLIKPEEEAARLMYHLEHATYDEKTAANTYANIVSMCDDPTSIASKFMQWSKDIPELKFISPFIRPLDRSVMFMAERTPIAWALSKRIRAEFAAGGARRDIALAQMGLGSLAMTSMFLLAKRGLITGKGPMNPDERANLESTGWKQDRVKIGDAYLDYSRIDSFGMLLGLSASLAEASMYIDPEDEKKHGEFSEIASASAMYAGRFLMDKMFFASFANFCNAIKTGKTDKFAKSFSGSFVPSVVKDVTRQIDPDLHELVTLTDALKDKLPGLSSTLPYKRDLWGRKVQAISDMPFYDIVSPIKVSTTKGEPIDNEIAKNRMKISGIPSTTSIAGGKVDFDDFPKAYSRYIELAGNEFKHPTWKKGAKDLLNDIVTGKHQLSDVYKKMSDGNGGGKEDFIRDMINSYRQLSQRQLLKEFPELKKAVEENIKQEQMKRMPIQ